LALFESHESRRNQIRAYYLENNGLRFWCK
jgi:hypothetical protein